MEFIECDSSPGVFKLFDYDDWDPFKGWWNQNDSTALVSVFNGNDWDWYNLSDITSREMLLNKLSELEKRNKDVQSARL